MEPLFKVGDNVKSKFDEEMRAIVLEVLEDIDGYIYYIEYSTGERGYWFEFSLELINI